MPSKCFAARCLWSLGPHSHKFSQYQARRLMSGFDHKGSLEEIAKGAKNQPLISLGISTYLNHPKTPGIFVDPC